MKKTTKIKTKRTPFPRLKLRRVPRSKLATEKKPLIIAAISLGAILVLLLLLIFGSGMFAGKAIYTGNTDTIGIMGTTSVESGKSTSLTIAANIGTKETIALSYQLKLPTGITCSNVKTTSLLGWDNTSSKATLVKEINTCKNNVINFEYANLDWKDNKTGVFNITKIDITALTASTSIGYNLLITNGEYIDFSNTKNITLTPISFTLTVKPASGTTTPGTCTDVDKDTYCKETTTTSGGNQVLGDCNDTNASIWKTTSAYKDADADGYGAGSLVSVCQGNSLPSGYSSKAGDCNDNIKTTTVCSTGQICTSGVCKTTETFVCTGSVPSNATLCSGDSTGLTQNYSTKLVSSCGGLKCEYICSSGYVYNATTPAKCSLSSIALKPAIVITATSGTSGTAISTLSKSTEYVLTATLTADKALTTPLFLVKITDAKNITTKAVSHAIKPSLAIGGTDKIIINYKPTETFVVHAYAWTNWPTKNLQGQSYGNNYAVTKKYEIS